MNEKIKHLKNVSIDGEPFDIYHINDEYYEVYDDQGNCLNEGELLFKVPSVKFIKRNLITNNNN